MDIFEQLGNLYDNAQSAVRGGNSGTNTPSSDNPVYQSSIPNERDGVEVRKMVKWFLPETGIVEMYINPKSIKYNDKKTISKARTKGGYIFQYWGEELATLNISGTTGSSGIEGINVLYDVYRNEQIALDSLALAIEASRERNDSTGGILENIIGSGSVVDLVGDLVGAGISSITDSVNNVIEYGNINPTIQKPTLASMAFQVEMYWSGWAFRGFFETFDVIESAESIGLFDYNINFTVTQKRGLRLNSMPWHRSPVNGPSNSDPVFGVPYSFGARRGQNTPSRAGQLAQSIVARSVDKQLKSYRPL
jgi:hypothetical protein